MIFGLFECRMYKLNNKDNLGISFYSGLLV